MLSTKLQAALTQSKQSVPTNRHILNRRYTSRFIKGNKRKWLFPHLGSPVHPNMSVKTEFTFSLQFISVIADIIESFNHSYPSFVLRDSQSDFSSGQSNTA